MQEAEEILFRLMTQGMNWSISVWWYWIPVGLGFLFRIGVLYSETPNANACIKAIMGSVCITLVLTLVWTTINANKLDDNIFIMGIGLTLIYIGYGLAEKCNNEGGTESVLLIIKSLFITLLSFQTIGETIVGVIGTIALACLAYKHWLGGIEKKSDLYEIFFLGVEIIVLSCLQEKLHIQQGIGVLLFVIFEETFIFMVNYLVKSGMERYLDSEADNM
ncbi:MAG: hypothetical protein ACLTRK_03520 [Waltera sp.]